MNKHSPDLDPWYVLASMPVLPKDAIRAGRGAVAPVNGEDFSFDITGCRALSELK